MTPSASHYAVRRVNPFEGVLQVVENEHARAYSPNGEVWQIQVLAERPDHTWRSFGHVEPIVQYFNFGLWDAEGGLQKIPANPVMDIGSMTAAAESMTATLRELLAQLPFELIDDHECWATDYHGNPIALLATTERPDVIGEMRVERWHATRLPDHGFISPSLLASGIPAKGDLGPRQHAERLERQVRQLGQHKVWFRRRSDGSGEKLPSGDSEAEAALPAARFPPLGLKTDWGDEQCASLASDYLEWQAPRLLTLQSLDNDQRRIIEQAACRQAIELEANRLLIPRILDHAAIEAARVEARLRRSVR